MVSDSVIKEDLNIYYLGGLLHNWNLINFNLECFVSSSIQYIYIHMRCSFNIRQFTVVCNFTLLFSLSHLCHNFLRFLLVQIVQLRLILLELRVSRYANTFSDFQNLVENLLTSVLSHRIYSQNFEIIIQQFDIFSQPLFSIQNHNFKK